MDQPAAVPEWASFFSFERFSMFMERVAHALTEAGVDYELSPLTGAWRDRTTGREFGLVNLAQVCNLMPMDDWDAEIVPFVQKVLTSGSEDELPKDYETLRPLLRVRLYAVGAIDPSIVVKQEIAEGFLACLVVDLPDKVMTLSPDRARTYGVSSYDLFEAAMKNVVEKTGAQRETHPIEGGVLLYSYSGDDFFVASLSLALESLEGPGAAYGRLIIVPNRHQTLWVDVADAASLSALGRMVYIARAMFKDGPGSISPYVYWVRAGRWQRLDVELSERGVGVQGPEKFIDEVLRPLLGEGA